MRSIKKFVSENLKYVLAFMAFFAVISFESEAILLYKNSRIPSLIILAMQFFILCFAIYLIFFKKTFNDKEKKILVRYTCYFIFIAVLNAWSTVFFVSTVNFAVMKTIAVRTMSMTCIWAFLVCCIYLCKNDTFYHGIFSAGSAIVLLSVLINFVSGSNAWMLVEHGSYVFKGVAGNRNSYILYIICILTGASVIIYEKITSAGGLKKLLKEKGNTVAVVLCAVLTVIALITGYLSKSATGLIISAACIILLIAFSFLKIRFPMWIIPVLFGAAWACIGIIGLDNIVPTALFEKVFHRKITFSSRTDLWDCADEIVKRSPFVGFGFDNTLLSDMHVLKVSGNEYINDPHNSILYILFTQGILGLIALLYMMVRPVVKAVKIKNNKRITFLLIIISAFIMRGLMESNFQYTNMILWSLIIALECEADREEESPLK